MKIKKRDKGEAITYVALGLMVLFLFYFFMASTEIIKKQNLISELQTVSHTYLLEMERIGYLDESLEIGLTKTLQELGFENISFNVGSKNQVRYGEMMELKFNCYLDGDLITYSKKMTSKYIEE